MLKRLLDRLLFGSPRPAPPEGPRAICGTPLVQAGILKLWGGYESQEEMFRQEGMEFARIAARRGETRLCDAAIAALGEERARELMEAAWRELDASNDNPPA